MRATPSTRSTADLVVLWLAGVIGAMVILGGIGLLAVILFRPDVDTSRLMSAISENVTVIVGALIGYLAGRNEPTRSGVSPE